MKVKVKDNRVKRKIKLPPLGNRIIKTGIAVFICLLIFMLRGYRGLVTQSCVAAIICIQPYNKQTIQEGINRTLGTFLGGAWGLLFLYVLKLWPSLVAYPGLVFFLMSVGIVLALYSTVLTKKTDAAALTAIVYICIAVDYPNLEAPVSLALHQVFDTLIGIAVAAYVNSFNMPRIKHPEYIFFVRLQDLVPDRYARVSGQVLVMLNRLYNEGARISLVSRWAPAFLLSQMGTMEINLPVIVMDGAALYDIGEKQYQYVKAIPKETAEKMEKLFLERNLGYCIYAVSESNMSVYRRGNLNEREEEDFQLMKRSPYRNYVSGEMAPDEQIAFIRLVDEDDRILELENELADLIPEDVRISTRKQPRVNGCSGLYFHHVDATIEKRKADLIRDLSSHGEHGLVPVDMVSEHSYRSEREALHMLSKLQDIYEPVSLLK